MQGFKTLAHLGWCLNPRRQRVEGNSIILLLLPWPSSSGQGSENHRAASRAATTQAMALGTVWLIMFGACALMNFHPESKYLYPAATGLIKNKLFGCFLFAPSWNMEIWNAVGQPTLPQQLSSRLTLNWDDNKVSAKHTCGGSSVPVCLTCF